MNRFDERLRIPTWIAAIALAGVLSSCNLGGSVDATAPTVDAWTPNTVGLELAETNERVTATFSEAIDGATLDTTSFALTSAGLTVPGAVSYHAATNTATYTPTGGLTVDTTYTATISTDVTDLAGNALQDVATWTFTTETVAAVSAGVVELASAEEFVLLAMSAITATAGTDITGNIGVSPAALSYVTGFDVMGTVSDPFVTSALVDGNIYAANLADPTPVYMDTATGAMMTAYTEAANRVLPAATTELGDGDLSGLNLEPGLYKWGTGVEINTDLTLTGNATDVWILQIAQDLTLANGIAVQLAGGALPENVFWQVAGQATLGTTSVMHGVILSKTAVVLNTDAVLNGRAYAQTAITLDAATVTPPTN